jgi:hypothetical protein
MKVKKPVKPRGKRVGSDNESAGENEVGNTGKGKGKKGGKKGGKPKYVPPPLLVISSITRAPHL